MLRRLTSIVILCLGLFGPTLAAYACAAEMATRGDCCPPGQQGACEPDAPAASLPVAGCCAASVATASSVLVSSERHGEIKPHQPLLAPTTHGFAAPSSVRTRNHAPDIVCRCTDLSDLYLRTGRLRL